MASTKPPAQSLRQCVEGMDCQRLKGGWQPLSDQYIEATSPTVLNSRIEERELFLAQAPA